MLTKNTRMFALAVFIFFTPVAFAQSDQNGQVEYGQVDTAGPLQTKCFTDHQGEHAVTECRALLRDGTLFILFPAQLPAYWGSMEIRVRDGMFQAVPGGIPFSPQDLTRKVIAGRLILSRMHYGLGDRISGFCDISYSEQGQGTEHSGVFSFTGTFSAVVHDENFKPLDDDTIAAYDQDTAIYELGAPVMSGDLICDPGVPAAGTPPELFSSEELKLDRFLQSPELESFRREVTACGNGREDRVRELTWDVSPEAKLSDCGNSFITIWFRQNTEGLWVQAAFRRWNKLAKE